VSAFQTKDTQAAYCELRANFVRLSPMEMKTFIIDAGLVLIGFLIGRFSAPRERTTTVYKPRAGVPASFAKPGGNPADAEIVAAIHEGRKIEAIKLYREVYGTDLKDAKDAVDALQAQQGQLGD
jgi:hypothetical protein